MASEQCKKPTLSCITYCANIIHMHLIPQFSIVNIMANWSSRNSMA